MKLFYASFESEKDDNAAAPVAAAPEAVVPAAPETEPQARPEPGDIPPVDGQAVLADAPVVTAAVATPVPPADVPPEQPPTAAEVPAVAPGGGELRPAPSAAAPTDGDAPIDGPEAEDFPESAEYETTLVDTEMKEDRNADQEESAAMESLFITGQMIQRLIKTGKCSQETLDLTRMIAQEQLNRLGYSLPNMGMESVLLDIPQQHNVVMEAISNIWQRGEENRGSQIFVMTWKHQINAITDLFKSNKSQITKYEGSLKDAKSEYSSKSSGPLKRDKHRVSMAELWYHFTTAEGPVDDIEAALKKDLTLSTYALTKHPVAINGLFEKLLTALKAYKSDGNASIVKLAKAVEGMANPSELFDKSLIGAKTFLSVVTVSRSRGAERKPLTLAGTTFTKLAELATADHVSESGSMKHGAKKVFAKSNGLASNAFNKSAQGIEFEPKEIEPVIDSGLVYLENCKKFMEMEGRFEDILNQCFVISDKIYSDIGGNQFGNSDDSKAAKAIVDQIFRYADNICAAFYSPASSELARSIKGAKYCGYLAKRMVYQLK